MHKWHFLLCSQAPKWVVSGWVGGNKGKAFSAAPSLPKEVCHSEGWGILFKKEMEMVTAGQAESGFSPPLQSQVICPSLSPKASNVATLILSCTPQTELFGHNPSQECSSPRLLKADAPCPLWLLLAQDSTRHSLDVCGRNGRSGSHPQVLLPLHSGALGGSAASRTDPLSNLGCPQPSSWTESALER